LLLFLYGDIAKW